MTMLNQAAPEYDFDQLLNAVSQTGQGRWFLQEYARRQRSSESLTILEAVKKLENAMHASAGNLQTHFQEPAKPLTAQQLNYFKQDEEIFLAPLVAAPVVQVVETAASHLPKASLDSKGATLKVQRSQQPDMAIGQAQSYFDAGHISTQELLAATSPAAEAPAEPKQRVIIIRQHPSELLDGMAPEEPPSEAAA